MSRLRIGVIGSGDLTNAVHLPNLAKHADKAEVVGLADIDLAAAQKTAEKFNVPRAVADYRELLPDVDAVFVVTPTYTHAEITVAALDAGKPVFCEKPMARTLEQAETMRAAAERTGLPLQIGFVRRYDEEWLTFRDSLQQGAIGRPLVWRDIMAGVGPAHRPWFTQDEQGGGPFLDGAIHTIDFALFTFGPAESVYTNGRTLRESNTAVDTGTATIRFASGDELLLAWSWGLPVGCGGGGRVFEMLGPKGRLGFPSEQPADSRQFVIDRGEKGGKELVSYPKNSLQAGFALEQEEFFAAVRGEKTPRAGAKEGIEALRVADALLRSAKSGVPEKVG